MKRKLQFLIYGILILFLAGCGKRDDISDAYGQIDGTETEQALLKDSLGVNEDIWEKSIEYNGKTININAAVTVPETDHMGVVAVEQVEMDAGYRKRVLEALCDGGEVFVLDEEKPPKWYMDSKLKNYDEKMKIWGEIWFEEEDMDLYEKYKDIAANGVENPDVPAAEYTGDLYYGKVDEKYTVFQFNAYTENELWWEPIDGEHTLEWLNKEKTAEGVFQIDGTFLSSVAGNESEMSREEAIQCCDAVLQKMGLDNYEALSAGSIQWSMYDEETMLSTIWTEGYEITYSVVIEGVKAEREDITFRITDAGILAAYINRPYIVKDTLVQSAKLLSYEEIKGVFSDVLKQNPEYFSFEDSTQTVDKMKLFYYTQEENGEQVRLPVWGLYDSESDYRILVNAMDGTVIGKEGDTVSKPADTDSIEVKEPGEIHDAVAFSEAPKSREDSLTVSLGVQESKWEEDIPTVFEDKDVNQVHIDADVIVPDTDSMPVVSMQPRTYTSEEKERIVDALFDKNSVSVLKDEEMHYYNATPGAPSGTYEENGYIGTVNGRKERLIFYMDMMILTVEEEKADMTKHAVDASSSVLENPGDTDYGNLCSMTQEEAAESVMEYLAQLGYTDYEVCETQYLNWTETDENGKQKETWTDGYFFTLARKVNGVVLDIEPYEIGIVGSYFPEDLYGIEWLMAEVNDQGLLQLRDINAYKGHKIEKDEELMSYQEAKDRIVALAKQEDAEYRKYVYSSFVFDEMKLMYFRSCAEDGSYRLIPVWRLSSPQKGQNLRIQKVTAADSIVACIMINAIDGTKIDLAAEFYDMPK